MIRKAVFLDWNKKVLRLYLIGDTHVGSKACNEKAIAELAKIIAADKFAAVVGLGDYTESVSPSDYRFNITEVAVEKESLDNIFYCQAARFSELMKPTIGKWAMLIPGNHETFAAHRYHTDPAALIAGWMGTKYQGRIDEASWLKVRFYSGDGKKRRGTANIYCQHGWGGGELRGGDALKLERLCYRKNAHAVLLAHVHRPHAFPVTVETLSAGGIEQEEVRWGVISYPMIGKHGYIAKHGGNAPPIGYAVLQIEQRRDQPVKISVELKPL